MYVIKRTSLFYRWLKSCDCENYLTNTCTIPKGVFVASIMTIIFTVIISLLVSAVGSGIIIAFVLPIAYLWDGAFSFNAISTSSVLVLGGASWCAAAIICLIAGMSRIGNRWDDAPRNVYYAFRKKVDTYEIDLGMSWYEFHCLDKRDQQFIMAEHGMYGPIRTWWILQKHKVCHKIEIVD